MRSEEATSFDQWHVAWHPRVSSGLCFPWIPIRCKFATPFVNCAGREISSVGRRGIVTFVHRPAAKGVFPDIRFVLVVNTRLFCFFFELVEGELFTAARVRGLAPDSK